MTFMVASAVSSFGMASLMEKTRLEGLVGAMEDCEDCQDEILVKTVNECLHTGYTDPCSAITCIKNDLYCWKCQSSPSVDDCEQAGSGALSAIQTLYDQPCSSAVGWHSQDIKGTCYDCGSGQFRCTGVSCGGGTGYGASPRNNNPYCL